MSSAFNLNEREKKVVIYGAVLAVLIAGYSLFSWYGDLRSQVSEVSDDRSFLLRKQINKIRKKESMEIHYEELLTKLQQQEKAVLRGTKPPVAAAALQRLLKENASALNIDVKLERALNHIDSEHYIAVPVEIGFTATTTKLKDLLLKLRSSSYLLTVSEIKIRVTNIRKPEDIYTTLVVTGFIKKQIEEPEDNKEGKNAA